MTGQLDQYTTFIETEEGIFEKYGIKLEITEYVAGINTIDAVVNGTTDTGEMADYALVNRIGNTLHDIKNPPVHRNRGKNYLFV